jgi:hypothetical protein
VSQNNSRAKIFFHENKRNYNKKVCILEFPYGAPIGSRKIGRYICVKQICNVSFFSNVAALGNKIVINLVFHKSTPFERLQRSLLLAEYWPGTPLLFITGGAALTVH